MLEYLIAYEGSDLLSNVLSLDNATRLLLCNNYSLSSEGNISAVG